MKTYKVTFRFSKMINHTSVMTHVVIEAVNEEDAVVLAKEMLHPSMTGKIKTTQTIQL
jgi:hypothetical protein